MGAGASTSVSKNTDAKLQQKQIDKLVSSFHALDLDGNGTITKAEFLKACKETLKEDMSEEEVDGAWSTMSDGILASFLANDENGDQKIKLDEYLLSQGIAKVCFQTTRRDGSRFDDAESAGPAAIVGVPRGVARGCWRVSAARALFPARPAQTKCPHRHT